MSLYYVLAVIVNKFKADFMFRMTTVGVNFVGGILGIACPLLAVRLVPDSVAIIAAGCFVVVLVLVATAPVWSKCFSEDEYQSEYSKYDVTISPEELCSHYNLSKKEIEVLGAMLAGKKIREIAAEQYISVDTVKSHRASIYNKDGREHA